MPKKPAVTEERFFDIFKAYYDLEKDTARRYGHGEYTLDRMAKLAALAGNPERGLRIIHVAGTKGKGSTSFFIGALLKSAGARVGVFTSPHLTTVRERFQLDGDWIGLPALLKAAEEWERQVRGSGIQATLFEMMTVLALRIFRDAGCEYAVMETGIGGLLDATNYIPAPVCTVITPVSLDHTQLLGSTIGEIAVQKAGVIKPGVPVVCSHQPFDEAETVIIEAALTHGCPLLTPEQEAACRRWPEVTVLPPFLRENFLTALRVMEVLGLKPRPAAFALPRLPARFEEVRETPPVILDAAHNADSARRLAEALSAVHPDVKFTVVLGVVAGKDFKGIFQSLLPVAHEFILTHPESPHKGSELEGLRKLCEAHKARHRVLPVIKSVKDLPAGEPLLFTGSFFTASIGARLFVA
jgi:dihydrofolate synthase/folylpolyglutamate synthase